ncbi:(2Fe-2S)-binding protein [Natrarchaeobius halalkaliphilus]|uniref:(2Fe-2S)-binding protein n=1 Tax=Natrarchaeobius halalkaliphilus TaxID=1679091 RepID=A0A3N6LSZ0_9EURY|nr:(2Fe-2S)-binding protein [Natrarchaeobius halalkaliphilus]RQG93103.1 (2Fe-2S)-binding protein [Natrarchaeobius halalkaliphilus]
MSTDSTGEYDGPVTEEITVTVNGRAVTATVEPRLKLSDFLRDVCGLHGVRVGCEHGVCGACTVQQDDRTVKSCLSYAVQADGAAIETVEGLDDDGSLHPIQEAFHETHALQCGFCTSGFVMATKELLEENPDPTREEIQTGLAGNICRCTGYQNIYDAVERAGEKLTAETGSEE